MNVPEDFARRVEDVFRGRLRIRYSPRRERFQVEQKVGRAALLPADFDEGSDEVIRIRDGYAFVLEVTRGDRVPCGYCGALKRVPCFEFDTIECDECLKNGHADTEEVLGYFPLGESLIDHLKKISPERGHIEETMRLQEELKRRRADMRKKDLSNFNENMAKETWGYVTERQQVGYGSKPIHSDKSLPQLT